jgi:5-methylcytosine-specific restriction endonuclease McrA
MTKDHVIPLSKGGNSTFSNLVSCCKACNSYKDNKTPEEIGLKLFKPPRELTNQEKVEVIIKSAKAKERKVWLECLEKNNINLW